MRYGRDVSLGSLTLRFGDCSAYVKHLKIDKLEAKFDKYIFIKYLKKTKGYYFYLADEQKVFISLRVVFLEKKFFGERINGSKIELEEV